MVKRGIDISAHQGDINLKALRDQDKLDFVIIRVGYGTKGTLDSKFKRNIELCESLDIPYGFYWYSYALNVEGAEKEANAFINAIKPYNPLFGCWFDMEDADGYKKKNGMPSNKMLVDICYTFCDKVENAGYYTGVYAAESWFKNQLADSKLARFDKWVAQWPTSAGKQKALKVDPNSRKDLSLWQFTSDGKFNGYKGNLDVNYAYKDCYKSEQPATPTAPTAPTAPTTPVAKFKIGDDVVINGALYLNANAETPSGNVVNKKTKITRYVVGAAHPYNTTDDLGWMNEEDIKVAVETVSPNNENNSITKGSKVQFIGTKSYSGIRLADWTHNDIFNVIELSGDRVVIGKGTAVTAAVNIKDCRKV